MMSKTRSLMKVAAIAAPVALGAMLVLSTGATARQAGGGTPQPGYWEYTTRVLGTSDTETKCVRASEIRRFFGGLSTRRWQCTYPVNEVGNGNARFEGTCREQRRGEATGRRINVRLSGPYAPESFTFRGGAQLARGTPFIPATITARRISAQCPAGAEYF